MKLLSENNIEHKVSEILHSSRWKYAFGKYISPQGLFCDKEYFEQAILNQRRQNSIEGINLDIPQSTEQGASQKIALVYIHELLSGNGEVHFAEIICFQFNQIQDFIQFFT